MAQFTPQMLLAQNVADDDLKRRLEAAIGFKAPASVAQMQKEQRMPATQAATSPLTAANVSPQPSEVTQTTSYSGSVLSPQEEQDRQSLMAKLAAAQGQNQTEQRAGIDDYSNAMNEYQGQKLEYDLRPLASVIDSVSGSNTYKLASDMLTDTPETKRQKLMQMKEKLQGLKGSVSKDELAYLKEQLNFYNDKIKMEMTEKRADQRAVMDRERLDRLYGKDIEANVQKLAKVTEAKASMDANVAAMNDALGFNIDEYDPKTNTVNGKKIDLPGASIPLAGRVAFYDERARVIEDTMARVFNTELKDRSGAAVTNQELIRLKDEFSSGRFQTEKEKLQAIQRYKKLSLEQLNRQESAFQPVVRGTYQGRIADPSLKMSGGSKMSPNAPAAGGLAPEKQKRLEELRAKKARGEI